MFFVENLTPDRITLDDSEARHALGSRRMRDGQTVQLFDGRGTRASGLIHVQSGKRQRAVTVQITERHALPRPSAGPHLYTAAPKGDRLRFLVEKCTELGAAGLHFVRWQRSVVEPSKAGQEKLRRVAIEACKQCGRLWLPEISIDDSIDRFCQTAPPRFYAHLEPGAEALPAEPGQQIAVAIGPEGGFSSEELQRFQTAGAKAVRLSEHILRTETAAIAVAVTAARQ